MKQQERIEQLRAAVIDGRTGNVRYRQNELFKLHEILKESAHDILSAISADTHENSVNVNLESEAEYYLTMNAVQRLYDSLDFEQALKDEYLVAHGTDNRGWRTGKGLVLIRPTTHTRFYSIIVAVATSIAAGNCTCLEVSSKYHNKENLPLTGVISLACRYIVKCRPRLETLAPEGFGLRYILCLEYKSTKSFGA